MNQSLNERAGSIISRMTLREKVSQMVHESRGISRLNIPAYNWWTESLHGVGRAGIATVFPQPIGLAAMFNDPLLYEIGAATSDEARAKYYESRRQTSRSLYKGLNLLPDWLSGLVYNRKYWYRGLTSWSPNINIFRDPRWGRGHETYGEDPFLTGRSGVAFIRGLQGDHPDILKVIATPKHFAVHSGPEKSRHGFNSVVSKKDLFETYLPAFRESIVEGKAASIMTAYNAINGEPSTSSHYLLQTILREEWGFEGFVVSDCGAVRDLFRYHRKAEKRRKAAAMAVNGGCDLNCGYMYHLLVQAVSDKLINEETLDQSVLRLFEARIRLGMFDPPEKDPYSTLSMDLVDCREHRALSRESARQSMVLLKNNGILPFGKELKTLAVIGPNSDSLPVLLGNYNGTPSEWTTPLEGLIQRGGENVEVRYARGCSLTGSDRSEFTEALELGESADLVVLCLGLSPQIEGEEGDAFNSDAGGDKRDLNLPGLQQELLDRLCAAGTPVVLVLLSGSPLDLRNADRSCSAIIQAWYPGEEGGHALADLLFGDSSPSGRLPVTFVRSIEELPPFEDYAMEGRTYRFMKKSPLYPFGFGLSYSQFRYRNLNLKLDGHGDSRILNVTVEVTNTGRITADEIVQFYYRDHDSSVRTPEYQLCSFFRISLNPGETRKISASLSVETFFIVNTEGKKILEPGVFSFYAGGFQPDGRSLELTGTACLEDVFTL